MPYIIYILYSKIKPKTYVGYTYNLQKRLDYHNKGKVKATRSYRPWKIIHTESVNSKKEAARREIYWKSGAGRRNIKLILNGFPPRF